MTTPLDSSTAARELADRELGELCRILIGADRDRLIAAIERLQQRGQFVDWQSQTLADAMRLALARDPDFAASMGAMISKGVHATVERDSEAFGRALAPAMGPAIRNAVWMMLQGFLQSIEAVVDQQLSWRSLRWRYEAWRTGRSFAEIAFVHTLLFRVEHVFLVYRHNGVQLLHATRPGVIARQPDLIAAMLTAIQDFVRDAFEAKETDANTSFTVGDLNVVVENGQHAALAAVVRGQSRAEIRMQLRDSLDRVETTMAQPLREFDGRTDAFEAVRPQVEACLMESQRAGAPAKRRKQGGVVRWLVAGAAIALVTWFVIARVAANAHARRLDGFVAALRAEPGYVVTEAAFDGGAVVVHGLRDPLARPFDALRREHHVEPFAAGDWQPHHSLHPQFLGQRLARALAPPAGAELALEDGTVHVRGRAGHEWLVRAATVARTIAGVHAVMTDGCVDVDLEAWQQTAARLRALDPDVQELADAAGGARREFAQLLRQLTVASVRLGRAFTLEAQFVWWTGGETSAPPAKARALVGDLAREHGLPIPLTGYVADTTVAAPTVRLLAKLVE